MGEHELSDTTKPSVPWGTGEWPTVPGYKVLAELGRGGMGTVYRAVDPNFERAVAVKVMHPGQDADRFVVEARITARLSHPGVPPVHALGQTTDKRPFLAMKLVEGRTLAAELAGAPASSGLLDAFERVCETVGFAHARGAIHRDLKPANVMLGAPGEVLVMDWGLARLLVPGEPGPAEVVGTPAYMAPEQARGEPVDARADVFALGGVLCAVLTGSAPFEGASGVEILRRAARAELGSAIARLDECDADAELVGIAKRCLSAAAADRYASGTEVAAAVAAHRAGVEARLRRVERDRAAAEAKAEEQRKRHRVQVLLAAALLVALAGLGAAAWLSGEAKQAKLRESAAEAEARYHRETSLFNAGVAGYTFASIRLAVGRDDPDTRARSERELLRAIEAFEESQREFPKRLDRDCYHALALVTLAELELQKGTAEGRRAALALCDRAEREFAALRAAGPNALPDFFTGSADETLRVALATVGLTRYSAYLNEHRASEALEQLDRLVPGLGAATPAVAPTADVAGPTRADIDRMRELGNPKYGSQLTGGRVTDDLLFMRAMLLRGAEMEQSKLPWSRPPAPDHAKAVRLAAHLADTRGAVGGAVYNAACALALASAAAEFPPEERERLAARAVAYLERLRTNGYFRHPTKGAKSRQELETDADLNPLRARPDFARVLEAVRAANG